MVATSGRMEPDRYRNTADTRMFDDLKAGARVYGFDVDGEAFRLALEAFRLRPEILSASAVLMRAAEAKAQVAAVVQSRQGETRLGVPNPLGEIGWVQANSPRPSTPQQPRRFYDSVKLDPMRPVKAFNAIMSAVIMELQRTSGTKVRLRLEMEAGAPDGFEKADIDVVRDNARHLKFNPDATGFDD